MPKEGEICVNCGKKIRRVTKLDRSTLDDATRPVEPYYTCGCSTLGGPVGPSDLEAPDG
jgi:hypothetical protein